MEQYTSNNSSFTKEKLQKAMKLIELPVMEFSLLDKYIADGNKMTDTLTMITSNEAFMDITEIKTVHGLLKIQYTMYIPEDRVYFMSPPKLQDLFKPNFNL